MESSELFPSEGGRREGVPHDRDAREFTPLCSQPKDEQLLQSSRTLFVVAFALSCFFAFWNLGEPSLRPGDESLHVSVVQEMLHSGSLFPRYEGKPYVNKPPLKMWLTLVPLKLFGESNFTYRVVDALATVGTLTVTYCLALALFGSGWVGLLAVVSMCGSWSYLFEHCARDAVQDSFLVFSVTLGAPALWKILSESHAAPGCLFRWGVVLGGSITAGVLCKHIAGGLLWCFPIVLLLVPSGRAAVRARWGFLLGALAASLLLPAIFYLWFFLQVPGSIHDLLWVEIYARASEGYHNKRRTFYYLMRLFRDGAYLPPLVLAGGLLFGVRQAVRSSSLNYTFLLVWGVFPVLLYSLAQSRLTWYIAPALPAWALLGAALIRELFLFAGRGASSRQDGRPVGARAAAAAAALLCCALLLLNVYRTAVAVLEGARRIELDWVTSRISRERNATHPLSLVEYDSKVVAPFEQVYVNMLGAANHRKVNVFPEFQSAVKTSLPTLVLTRAELISQVVTEVPLRGYRFISPVGKVPKWMVRPEWLFLGWTVDDPPSVFHPLTWPLPLTKSERGSWSAICDPDPLMKLRGLLITPTGTGSLVVRLNKVSLERSSLEHLAESYIAPGELFNGAGCEIEITAGAGSPELRSVMLTIPLPQGPQGGPPLPGSS